MPETAMDMQFLLKVLFISVAVALSQWLFPWWAMPIAAGFVTFLLSPKEKRRFSDKKGVGGGASFGAGMLSGVLVWGLYGFVLNLQNQSILAPKVAEIITQQPNAYLILAITAVVGGIVAGMGSLTGHLLGVAVKAVEWKKRRRRR